jgi:hypothetical protein
MMGAFNTIVELEAKLVDAVTSSPYTKLIADADRRRDKAVAGITLTVNAALRHVNPDIVEAARRIELLLKAFRSTIENKPYEEESSAVQILISDLMSTYADEVKTLNLQEWIDELSAAQMTFDSLFEQRNDEWAARPQENLRAVRKKVNEYYREMITLIEAYGKLNGYDVTGEFILKLNREVKYFNDHIHHKGKKDIDAADIDDIPDQVYAGEPLFPMPVVYYEGEKLLFTIDYEVSYHDNDRPGTAKITVHGKGEYTGIKEVSFKITGMVNN